MWKQTSVAVLALFVLGGCHPGSNDARVSTPKGVQSDTLGSNVITRPVGDFVNFLVGKGIEITNVIDRRTQDNLLQVQVSGVNHSTKRKIIDYRTEWLDKDGILVDSAMTRWESQSVMPKGTFSIVAIAPHPRVTDFRMNTRPNKTTK